MAMYREYNALQDIIDELNLYRDGLGRLPNESAEEHILRLRTSINELELALDRAEDRIVALEEDVESLREYLDD